MSPYIYNIIMRGCSFALIDFLPIRSTFVYVGMFNFLSEWGSKRLYFVFGVLENLGAMGKLSFGNMLDCLYLSSGSCSCFCTNTLEDEFEKKPLITSDKTQLLRLKDVVAGNQTLAFQLKPKVMCSFISLMFSLFS